MSSTTGPIQPSTIETTDGNSPSYKTNSTDIGISIDLTAISGTNPTIDFEVQWSPDLVNWGSADGSADTFTQLTAVAVVAKVFTVKAPFFRLKWTITGTAGPSMTFSAVGVYHARGR